MNHIKISDCAVVLQGKNIDKKYLNTDGKGLPYIVGASCIKGSGLTAANLIRESYCTYKYSISS